MKILHKAFGAHAVKVIEDAKGEMEAIVSVFNNVDAAGERVKPGFFTKSLQGFLPKGVWMHDWTQPVAKTIEARELLPGDPLLPEALQGLGGLYIKGQFNLATQRGKDAFSDLTFGTVDQFSFGFCVTRSVKADDGVTDLLEGTIYEWSPVLVGCNPATFLLSAKGLPAPPALKGLLSEYLPQSMGLAALGRAQDALYYSLYDILYGWGDWADASPEEQIAAIEKALDEFSVIVTQVLSAILGSAKEMQDAELALKALMKTMHPRLAKEQSAAKALLSYSQTIAAAALSAAQAHAA